IAQDTDPPELDGFRYKFEEEKKSLAQLQRDLNSPDQGRRHHAICDLQETTDRRAARLFLSVINDESQQSRIMAIQGLGRIRSVAAIPELARLIREDKDAMIVFNAMVALRDIKSRRTFPALIDATRHVEAFVRRDAAIALGEIGDESVLPELQK